jgi:eukaryotic-like serine/threonine-protein kinase
MLRLRLILIGLFFALMFACSISTAYLLLGTSYTSSFSGWGYRVQDGRVFVATIDPRGPAELQPADEIIEFNGKDVRKGAALREFFSLAEAGTHYDLVLVRNGQSQRVSLKTLPLTGVMWLGVFASTILIPLFFQAIALTIFLLRPRDQQALLVSLTFATMSVSGTAITLPVTVYWLKLLLGLGATLASLSSTTAFHFTEIFPEHSRLLKRFPRFELLHYIPSLLVIVPGRALFHWWLISNPTRALEFARSPFFRAGTALILLYVAGSLLMLLMKYRYANQVSRRKLRVMLAGAIVGASPALVLSVSVLVGIASMGTHWAQFGLVATFAMLLIPISFAYAIVRHQVIPVSLIVRRSVQYLLAKNALRVLLGLPILGVVISIIANPNRSVAEILLRNSLHFYLLAVLAIAIGLFFRRHLTSWIDRKFFREQYDQDRILRELADDIKTHDSLSEMSRMVSKRVDAALHPQSVYLFYRQEERRDLSLGYSSGGTGEELRIPEEFELLRFMSYQGGAQEFPFATKINLPQKEKEWLAQLGTNLIVPMTGLDKGLTGLFLLGRKKSEVPYTANDRRLLETVADQIALVYENVRLKERVDQERRIKHEVLARVEERNINLLKECTACGECYDSTQQVCPNDQRELTLTLPVERTIEGRYRLDKLIGRGGMGAVYKATDLRLSRTVAVKIISGQFFGNSEALRRFEREARTSARLQHPNIITVFDYGVLSTEGAYLVMELVRGDSLGRILKRDGPLSPPSAADWLDQVLAAVGAAHGAGVIHRDLKPDNIFIAQEDEGRIAKVLDFGLAKIARGGDGSGEDTGMTTPGAVLGTFGYMSPEQLSGEHVDERTDLFSLGVIAVEMITGRRPFGGNSYHEHLTAILQNTFQLKGEGPEVEKLNEVLQSCLAKEPTDRFASATEMRKELIPVLRDCPALQRETSVSLDADTAIF